MADYKRDIGTNLFTNLFSKERTNCFINDEVEVIEDKKIPKKIDQNDRQWHYSYNTKKIAEEVADNLEHLRQKVNKIIDYLEEKDNDR